MADWLSGDDISRVTKSPGERVTLPTDEANTDPMGTVVDRELGTPLTHSVPVRVLVKTSLTLIYNSWVVHACEIKRVFRKEFVDELPRPT